MKNARFSFGRCGASLCLAALLAACGSDQPQPPLPSGVSMIDGIGETLAHQDLEPLRGIVGNAHYVGLGESVHTSGGYEQAKYRLFRWLVEEMGFRTFAIESPWIEAMTAANYVAACQGTSKDAIHSLFMVWSNSALQNMVEWMCSYNQTHAADPLSFYGFDVQESWDDAPAVRRFLDNAAPADAARLSDSLDPCLGATSFTAAHFYGSAEYTAASEGHPDPVAHQRCLAGLDAVGQYLDANAAHLQAATSAQALELARISLVAISAFEGEIYSIADFNTAFRARDVGMAELVMRLNPILGRGQRTAIWAHNFHVSRRLPTDPMLSMGTHLSDALGSDYVPVGLIGYNVETNSQFMQQTPPIPVEPDAVELILHRLGRPYLLVDLSQPVGDSLLVPGTDYLVGGTPIDPYRQFQALFFLDHSPPMTYIQ
jgi:erythromycin esterase